MPLRVLATGCLSTATRVKWDSKTDSSTSVFRKSRLVLYMRPQDLEEHVNELAEYQSTKSALRFPLDQAVPVTLIKKLVKGAVTRHEVGEQDSPTRRGS